MQTEVSPVHLPFKCTSIRDLHNISIIENRTKLPEILSNLHCLYTFCDFCNVYGSTLPAGTKLGSHAWVEGTEELGGLISYNWVLHTNSIVPHVHHFICSRTWIKLFEINKVFFSVGFSRGNFSLSIYHTYFIYSLAQILVFYRTVDLYDPAGMKKVTCSMTDSRL